MEMACSANVPRFLRILSSIGIATMFIAQFVPICNATLNICNGNTNTSAEFWSNLNIVLNNLADNTSLSNGFNTSVSGQSTDRAYGLLQCMGNVSVEECFNCSHEANTTIRKICGDAIGGRLWLDKCFLRYENYPFAGQLSTDKQVDPGTAKVLGDPLQFSAAVKALFKNLSDEALLSSNRFSSGQTNVSLSYQIFGFVQCWKDITSVEDCGTCLSIAFNGLLDATENGTRLGAVVGLGSCIARYNANSILLSAPPLQLPSTPPIHQPPSSPLTLKKSSKKIGIVLGTLGGLLVIVLLCLFAIRRKLKSAVLRKLASVKKDTDVDSVFSQEHEIIFNLDNIKVATANFHDDNKLGEGGFGCVYKGTMPDGKQIAVKKLSLQSSQGKKEFLNEVKLVAKIQHRNLVNLLGCCAEGSERLLVYEFLANNSLDKILFREFIPSKSIKEVILVYEFLANNSLDKILFHPQRSKELDWNRRLNIICGVARGLLYLHQDSQLRIIHRDIKASNILLDEKLEPKISDFGLARLVHQDETHINTRVAGTYGYMAPEYAMLGQLSAKADVYSFGVVILEIICGRKNTDVTLLPEFQSLLDWVWRSYSRGNIVDIIDTAIIGSFSTEEVSRYVHIGLLCTQAAASLRPPMLNVYAMLSNLSITNLPDVTKPAYLSADHNDVPAHTHKSTSTTTSTTSNVMSSSYASSETPLIYPSINDASVTVLDAR